MNYPIPNINLVYFFRDVWVEGSAFRAGSKKYSRLQMDKRIGSVQNRVSFVYSQTEISGLVI